MNTIIVQYDPFAMESRLTIVRNGQYSYGVCEGVKELIDTLFETAYAENIYDIKLHAPPHIVEEISMQIKEKEKATYSKTTITIEEI